MNGVVLIRPALFHKNQLTDENHHLRTLLLPACRYYGGPCIHRTTYNDIPMSKRKDGTTDEQWAQYEEALRMFDKSMQNNKPRAENFKDSEEFERQLNAWQRVYFMDAPNKPGYYRANND